MIVDNLLINEFRPLLLTVEKIGPFQEKPFVLDMVQGKSGEPCNFFMLISGNGRGKTTLLEVLTVVFNALSPQKFTQFGFEDLDAGMGAWARLDIKVNLQRDTDRFDGILSLAIGEYSPEEQGFSKPDLLERLENPPIIVHGFRRRKSGRLEEFTIGDDHNLVKDLIGFIQVQTGVPQSFGDPDITLPTLLYFDTKRDIPRATKGATGIVQPANWGYQLIHKCSDEGQNWDQSLDNLLVWLKWLDDGSFDKAAKRINETVFIGKTKFLKNIRKQPPHAVIQNGRHEHRIDRLSSGEKSLIQMLLRMETHRTMNTWILIDELEAHFHPNMALWFLKILKQMVRDCPGLTLITTSHSRAILKAFAFEIKEKGLVKDGFLIEDDLEVTV